MKNLGVIVAAALLLSGCVLKYPQDRNSKYTVDISNMEKSEVLPETFIYRHPLKRVRNYPILWLDTLEVLPKPAKGLSKGARIDYDLLAEELKVQVHTMLARDFKLVNKPGRGVLELKIVIVDIKPIVRTVKDGNDVIVTDTQSKGVKFELDAVDYKTGDLVFAISTLHKEDHYALLEDPNLLAIMQKDFTEWVKFLADSLKKAKADSK